MDKKNLTENLKDKKNWQRLLLIFLYIFIFGLVKTLVVALGIFQFGYLVITGELNRQVKDFCGVLSVYIKEIIEYITLISDEKPFPVGQWPELKLSNLSKSESSS